MQARMNAHPSTEYENMYTVTWGMNHQLWSAGISDSS